MVKDPDPPVERVKLSPRSRLEKDERETRDALSTFERNHHDRVEIEDMTKAELVAMIEREGLELPGETTFDVEKNVYVKERLKKRDYLEFIRQKLYSTDKPPSVKKGKKLGKNFCVVSIYKSLRGAVRIIAYDTDRSMEYVRLSTERHVNRAPPNPNPPRRHQRDLASRGRANGHVRASSEGRVRRVLRAGDLPPSNFVALASLAPPPSPS
jgi:hypothetical protein